MEVTDTPVKTKRPVDGTFTQQKLPGLLSDCSGVLVALIFVLISIVFLPVGTTLRAISDETFVAKVIYDDGPSSPCYISQSNEGKSCQVLINFNRDVEGPIYVYYQLSNFFQNHRRYFTSRSISQLQGQDEDAAEVKLDCNPLYQNGTLVLNPCGLIANSFFNDEISLNTVTSKPAGLVFDESGIAVQSDRESLFKQVVGFQSAEVPSIAYTCAQAGLPDGCRTYVDKVNSTYEVIYKFYYPNEDTVQYLYETYPNQISPIEGVTNEHFIVWMRTAMLPTFRNLYARIDGDFVPGDQIALDIIANFEVDSFDGTKSIVATTMNAIGGKNPTIGDAFITVGSLCLVLGIVLGIKEVIFLKKMIKSNRD